ncbi:biotin/lipoyl-containing protein [Saccharomonospora viridis]|jgi:pyruvate/2-oxoglutarate dehydrogenase complex dihydrolipoamide acyltransferase (E2) component|uniref:Pyruvate/2-oxoglutarate dehydrogenase complex, dihydrolipoamide acyltransferase component n=2 Tax=Saccharomonospora viridis TaxID=1852 RepID=C7MWP5_SACVD|nr:lipoyl domain-containing protein [Saccharomonospora viridis]ACU97149.1 pyruvate/2-oxoglutarate dehydrogenase complex, dihydrolipoamide acyltransferase component [Saccharomonospora viridis DSM 43017]KHF43398.1 biotin attachment protein [Saccharomonospora viridis]SFO79563.1 Biotin-requiring enzyme [Saccharomonospora viridis]
MTEIPFPVVSAKEPEAEGVLATWFAEDGQRVSSGELIAEVAVDKVDVEVPAPASGVLRLLVAEGDVVKQGTPIARLE